MATDPEFYRLDSDLSGEGINQGDLHKILYDLVEAIKAICEKLDEDVGSIGIDYAENVSDILATSLAKLKTPIGITDT